MNHDIFASTILLNIINFDHWEKQLANKIIPLLKDKSPVDALDNSANSLKTFNV